MILLAEDEKSTRNLAKRILQHAGYTVIEADNGLDALQKAKDYQGSIDLLFTDVVMPVMGGKELSEKLTLIHPRIEVLFTSGYRSCYSFNILITQVLRRPPTKGNHTLSQIWHLF